MPSGKTPPHRLALDLAGAWNLLERRLSGAVSFRGISFSEYRLLSALADFPEGAATRADLAAAVGLTPSGVTRALQPLEKIRIVRTKKSPRDARLALATLTAGGRELVDDCTAAVADAVTALAGTTPTITTLITALTTGPLRAGTSR